MCTVPFKQNKKINKLHFVIVYSICMSSDQTETESSSEPIPISNNTGSLPDLTNLHIPSPLPTPLDPEDQQVTSFNHGGGSPTNLSSSMPSPTHLSMAPTNHTQVLTLFFFFFLFFCSNTVSALSPGPKLIELLKYNK